MNKLAFLGGEPIRTKPWPSWPISDTSEEDALLQVLRSGNWWRHSYGQGVELIENEKDSQSKVAEFQREFANYRGCKYGIAAANGTVTIEIGLRAVGIKPGDEVIVPPYTYFATASAVLMVGAIPIFVDIDSKTYNIDPLRIEEAITDRTKAIIPVHFGGQPCEMDAIRVLAKKHNLIIIEDAAHSHGSSYNDQPTGSLGELGSFSFQNSKPMTAGEGGIITTNRKDFAEILESLVWAGRKKGQPWYKHFILASNCRLTEFQGAILSAQLTRLDGQVDLRMKNANYLDRLLKNISGIEPLTFLPSTTRHTYHIYMFKYNPDYFYNLSKETFVAALQAEGITGVMGGYTNPLYLNPVFLEKNFMGGPYPMVPAIYPKELDYGDFVGLCPVTQKACETEAVWLFQNMLMGSEEDMEDISMAIQKIQMNSKKLLDD